MQSVSQLSLTTLIKCSFNYFIKYTGLLYTACQNSTPDRLSKDIQVMVLDVLYRAVPIPLSTDTSNTKYLR